MNRRELILGAGAAALAATIPAEQSLGLSNRVIAKKAADWVWVRGVVLDYDEERVTIVVKLNDDCRAQLGFAKMEFADGL